MRGRERKRARARRAARSARSRPPPPPSERSAGGEREKMNLPLAALAAIAACIYFSGHWVGPDSVTGWCSSANSTSPACESGIKALALVQHGTRSPLGLSAIAASLCVAVATFAKCVFDVPLEIPSASRHRKKRKRKHHRR